MLKRQYFIHSPPPLKKQRLENTAQRLVVSPVSCERLHRVAALRRRLESGLSWKPCKVKRNQRIGNKTCRQVQCVLGLSFSCSVVNHLASSELPITIRSVCEPSPLLDVVDMEIDVQGQAVCDERTLSELFNNMRL